MVLIIDVCTDESRDLSGWYTEKLQWLHLTHCHFVHHKSHMYQPGLNQDLRGERGASSIVSNVTTCWGTELYLLCTIQAYACVCFCVCLNKLTRRRGETLVSFCQKQEKQPFREGFLYLLVLQFYIFCTGGLNFLRASSFFMQDGCFARRLKPTERATSVRPDVARDIQGTNSQFLTLYFRETTIVTF